LINNFLFLHTQNIYSLLTEDLDVITIDDVDLGAFVIVPYVGRGVVKAGSF